MMPKDDKNVKIRTDYINRQVCLITQDAGILQYCSVTGNFVL